MMFPNLVQSNTTMVIPLSLLINLIILNWPAKSNKTSAFGLLVQEDIGFVKVTILIQHILSSDGHNQQDIGHNFMPLCLQKVTNVLPLSFTCRSQWYATVA